MVLDWKISNSQQCLDADFVTAFIFSVWHNTSFAQTVLNPTKSVRYFRLFTHKILNYTSIPYSVVVLALKYVHRLKSLKPSLCGAPGSECRVLVCTLMLAMKFLIDNHFSNKTWHTISEIPLCEINVAEMEFLNQLNHNCNVRKEEYFDWSLSVDHFYQQYRQHQARYANPALSLQYHTNYTQPYLQPNPYKITREGNHFLSIDSGMVSPPESQDGSYSFSQY